MPVQVVKITEVTICEIRGSPNYGLSERRLQAQPKELLKTKSTTADVKNQFLTTPNIESTSKSHKPKLHPEALSTAELQTAIEL